MPGVAGLHTEQKLLIELHGAESNDAFELADNDRGHRRRLRAKREVERTETQDLGGAERLNLQCKVDLPGVLQYQSSPVTSCPAPVTGSEPWMVGVRPSMAVGGKPSPV